MKDEIKIAEEMAVGVAVMDMTQFVNKWGSLKHIEGETPKFWKVDGSLYRKDNLRLHGSSSAWESRYIRLATQQDLRNIRGAELRKEILELIPNCKSLTKLEEIKDILDRA